MNTWIGWKGTSNSAKAIKSLQQSADWLRKPKLEKALDEAVEMLNKVNNQIAEINQDLQKIQANLDCNCPKKGWGNHEPECDKFEDMTTSNGVEA